MAPVQHSNYRMIRVRAQGTLLEAGSIPLDLPYTYMYNTNEHAFNSSLIALQRALNGSPPHNHAKPTNLVFA